MEELAAEIVAEKERSRDLQVLYDAEKLLRVKAEHSLHELRKAHEKMAVKGEMEEEMIVNKVQRAGVIKTIWCFLQSFRTVFKHRHWFLSFHFTYESYQLLNKINEVQHDKEKLAIDLEREEECLTNNLQRQLRQIGIEKSETEAEVDDLKRQLGDMKIEREKVSDRIYKLINK